MAVVAVPFPFDRLPGVSRTHVRGARLLGARLNAAALAELSRDLAQVLDVGVRVSCLRLGAVCCAPQSDRAEPLVVAAFSHAVVGRAYLLLDAALAVDLAARLLRSDEIAAPRPLSGIEQGLLGYLALLALRRASGWRLDSIDRSPPALADGGIAADFEVALGDGPLHGARLVTDLPTILNLPKSPPRWDRLPRLARVPLDLPIVVATARLAPREIRSLCAGDVIVADEPRVAELRVGHGRVLLQALPHGFSVAACYESLATRMGDDMDDKRDLLEDMPLELTAEVGRFRLSAKELLDLEPGAVLPLSCPTAGPVDVACGGRVVARGELVDIEGERGVRLTELL